MLCSCVLFTNNPLIKEKTEAKKAGKNLRIEFINGTSLDVLLSVRDAVHLGAKILTHPLYGNLRPYQQPYRTVLLEDVRGACGSESLTLVENALDVYQSCADRIMRSENLSEQMRDDYAFVDFELMRESFAQYKI